MCLTVENKFRKHYFLTHHFFTFYINPWHQTILWFIIHFKWLSHTLSMAHRKEWILQLQLKMLMFFPCWWCRCESATTCITSPLHWKSLRELLSRPFSRFMSWHCSEPFPESSLWLIWFIRGRMWWSMFIKSCLIFSQHCHTFIHC